MIRTVKINFKGFELKCKGYHHKPNKKVSDTSDQECFEVDSVSYNETDITDLLNVLNFDWSEIECLCLNSLKD